MSNAISLLPFTAAQIRAMPETTAQALIAATNAEQQRAHQYATLGLICGAVSFLGCVAAYSYLVMNGHQHAAAVILGAGALATVGRLISVRL